MKYLLGKKVGMTQYIDQNGRAVAATVIEAGPCYVTQVKENTPATFQIGFSEMKKANKPMSNHLKEKKLRNLREFKFDDDNQETYKLNAILDLSLFDQKKPLMISGITKGKGFAGTVKRHNFAIGPMSHGSKSHREPGSTGCMYPQRPVKGRKLPGRMGTDKKTMNNVKVLNIETDKNLLVISGSIPGNKGSLITIKQS